MKSHQRILFVADARLIYRGTTMEATGKNEVKPGLNLKKIVVTTHKLYVFRALSNEADDIEYRLQNSRKPKPMEQLDDRAARQFTSVTGDPENEIDIQEKLCKVILEEQPTVHQYIKKLNVITSHRSVKNSVLLLSPINRTVQMIFFDRLKEAFRFAKAINCANAWLRYLQQCQVKKVRQNTQWTCLLQDIIYNEDALVVVDPLEFNDQNEEQEISCYQELLERAAYINRLQLKFKIKNDYGYMCAGKFLGLPILNGLRTLQLTDCGLTDDGIEQLQGNLLRLTSLNEINLSRNTLTDRCLKSMAKMILQCPDFNRIRLSKNQLQFGKQDTQMLLLDLLRSSQQLMHLDFSENKLQDSCIELIERAVIFAQNPPLKELDLSSNLFSKYGSWRLFKGNLIMIKNHEYMVFLLYPIPFNIEIFTQGFEEFPVRRTPTIKPPGNLPLSLSQELIEQTNTITSLTLSEHNSTGLVIRRKIHSGKPLPKSYNDVASMTQVKTRLSKLIGDKNTKLQDILKQCAQIEQQKFGYPSSVLEQITYYIWEKLNEALLVRDHESIGLLKRAAMMINVDLNPYRERLAKVEKRKDIYSTKLREIYNFELNQFDINRQLDEMVKEGLRISLKGKPLNFLFYLKDLRDKKIRQLIALNYNPIVELEDLKTRNYATFFDVAADSNIEWQVPYQLQQQKDINQNLYLFHLQSDYDVLARLQPHEYQRMQTHLRSVKLISEKFIKYLRLAEQRIKFIINEYYQSFSFNTFKISFVELKINACRHLWQYRNIRRTMLFFNLPSYTRKMPVSPEKCVVIGNKQSFCHRYAIENYPNILQDVWQMGAYGYRGKMTKYSSVDFQNQCKELCSLTEQFIRMIVTFKDRVTEQILPAIFKIARFVQNGMYPQQLLEEFYLHLICMQEQPSKNTELVVGLVPFLTLYLKPPRTVEKTLLAFLARNDFSFSYMPMSIEYDSDLEVESERVFVQRDWIPKNKYAMQMINRYGKVTVKLNTPLKTFITLQISEVENVGDLMYQVYLHEYLSPFYDKYSFWIFKANSRTYEETTFDCQDLIGEILNDMNEEEEILIIKRRVYSPYYTINLRDYSNELLTSIFYEIKYYYLQQTAYKAYDEEIEVASIFAFVAIFDPPNKKTTVTDFYTEFKIYVDNLDRYLDDLFPKYYLAERDAREIIRPLKNRMNERLARQEQKSIQSLKRKLVLKFRDQPYFCSSNYRLYSETRAAECVLSINSMFISQQFDLTIHYIFLENVVNFVPHERHINIRYYDKERGSIEELSFRSRDKQSMAIIMDFLSYCTIRIKTPNIFLYLQREMYAQLIRYSLPMSLFDYQTQMNTSIVVKKVSQAREQLPQTTVDEIVQLFQRNLKRLEKLKIVIETGRDYAFQRQNLFVKTYINRLQYPYRVGKALELCEPLGPKPKKLNADLLKENNKQVPDEREEAVLPEELQKTSPPEKAEFVAFSRKPSGAGDMPTAEKLPPRPPTPTPPQPENPPPQEQPPVPGDDQPVVINRGSRTGARDSRNRNSRDRRR